MYDDLDLQRIYDKKYFDGRGSEQKWERRAKFIQEKFNPQKMLDVGCSWGQIVYHLHKNGIDAYGIDGSDAALAKADKSIKHKLYKVNLNEDAFPFEDKIFDFITGFYSIEHIHNFEFFTDELKRVLKDDGIAWFLTPDEGEEFRNEKDVFTNKFENWKNFFEKYGFSVTAFDPYEMMELKGKLRKFHLYKLPEPLQKIAKKIAYDVANKVSMKDTSFIVKKINS
jgi:ubiquinone/menaquinone biosynthesis C-methylase UbiE